MKQCPKCEKTYDDSWGVCLKCNMPLARIEGLRSSEETKKEQALDEKHSLQLLNIDVKRLEVLRKRMKRDIKFFIGSWGLLILMFFVNSIAGNNFILNNISGFLLAGWLLGFIIFRLLIIFGIRRIYTAMKDKPKNTFTASVSLLQLVAFVFPFGELIISSEALKESKRVTALLSS